MFLFFTMIFILVNFIFNRFTGIDVLRQIIYF